MTDTVRSKQDVIRAVLPIAYQFIKKYGEMERAGVDLNSHEKAVYSLAMGLHVLLTEDK